jgi:hypothetical protein
LASSSAAPANAAAVLFKAPAYIDICSRVWFDKAEELMISGGMTEEGCLGSNQLLLKSKKQWSDQ